MKLPKNITLNWLEAPNAEFDGVSNARVLVAEHQIGAVPKALLADFLGLMDKTNGITPLHDICLCGESLREVADSLTRQLLTQASTGTVFKGMNPLDFACANGHQEEIPWNSFTPEQWISRLDLLRRCQKRIRIRMSDFRGDEPFFKFIEKVEKLKEISDL